MPPLGLGAPGEGAAAVARPRGLLRRGRLARVVGLAAAAPLVATVLFFGLQEPELAEETLLFVNGPGGLRLLRSPSDRLDGSALARRAGYETSPGARPGATEGAPPDAPKKINPRNFVETPEYAFRRVARRIARLKAWPGKFVPYGHKPWDPPRFTKVCIQARLKAKQAANTKVINQVIEEMRRISGKHPWVVKAKTNVAAFGWRVGDPCGVAVTLRGALMKDFLQRLNTIILPRIRDFEGLYPSSFDRMGNFVLGLENQEAFKELDELIDSREIVHGFDISIYNNCFTQPDGFRLMKEFGFPFGEPRPPKRKGSRKSFVVMRPEKK